MGEVLTFPLESSRLLLSPLAREDRGAFVAYRRNPDIARYQGWTPDYTIADADELLAGQPETDVPEPGGWLQIAIRDRETGALLGDLAIHTHEDQPDTYELGVTLDDAAQGAGIATEALRVLIAALYDQRGTHRLIAQCDARNSGAAALFTRLGFRHEARHVDADFFKEEWTTLDVFAQLATER